MRPAGAFGICWGKFGENLERVEAGAFFGR
nr:MAG TPA: hypothetical protein [Bacteriophage sp.]